MRKSFQTDKCYEIRVLFFLKRKGDARDENFINSDIAVVFRRFYSIIAAIAAIIITESNKKKKQNELWLKMLMVNYTKPSQKNDNPEEKQ